MAFSHKSALQCCENATSALIQISCTLLNSRAVVSGRAPLVWNNSLLSLILETSLKTFSLFLPIVCYSNLVTAIGSCSTPPPPPNWLQWRLVEGGGEAGRETGVGRRGVERLCVCVCVYTFKYVQAKERHRESYVMQVRLCTFLIHNFMYSALSLTHVS